MADEPRIKTKAKSKKSAKASKSAELEKIDDVLPDDEAQLLTVSPGELNRLVLGDLLLHYPERDVTVVSDGATAGRVLRAFAHPRLRKSLQDTLADASLMTNLWSTFDVSRLLGVSWYPSLEGKSSERMTIDPPAPG